MSLRLFGADGPSMMVGRRPGLCLSRPLDQLEIVQSAAGNTAAATPADFDATLSTPSTTGNSLILVVGSDATIPTPNGWTLIRDAVSVNALYMWAKTSEGDDEVTVTPNVAVSSAWWFAEVAGIDLTVLGSAEEASGQAGLRTTGTTGATTGATGGLAFAAWAYTEIDGGSNNVASMTNGFAEVAETITTRVGGGNNNVGLTVATLTPTEDGTFESTATFDNLANGSSGVVAVFGPEA